MADEETPKAPAGKQIILKAPGGRLKTAVGEVDPVGELGNGVSVVVTTADEVPETVWFLGILRAKPPDVEHAAVKYKVINGDSAGLERVRIGSRKAGTARIVVVYDKANMNDLDDACGKDGGTIVMTMPDGGVFSGTGGMIANGAARVVADQCVTDEITFGMNAGFTFTPA